MMRTDLREVGMRDARRKTLGHVQGNKHGEGHLELRGESEMASSNAIVDGGGMQYF